MPIPLDILPVDNDVPMLPEEADVPPAVWHSPAMTRGRFLVWSAAILVAAAEAAGTTVLNLREKRQRTEETIKEYVLTKFGRLPTRAQLIKAIPYGGSIVPVFDLAHMQQLRGTSGPIDIREAAVGTSMTYGLGTMNDTTGPLDQSHSAPQLAYESLDDLARAELGIGSTEVWTGAVPGADSGDGNPEDPRGLYGVHMQLQSPGMQAWLRDAPDETLPLVRYETFGLDDLRRLAPTIGNLVELIGDVFHLATSTTATDEIKAHIDELERELIRIALQYKQNMIEGAAIINSLNAVRTARGQLGLHIKMVYTHDVGEADNVPFSAIAGGNDDPRMRGILRPDEVDTDFPNRYYLDLTQIPFGHELAHWAWVLMFMAQNEALAEIRNRYPDVPIAPEIQLDANRAPNFYTVLRPDGVLIPKGDGHSGIRVGRVGGVQELARRVLRPLGRTGSQGLITADTRVRFRGLLS